MTTFEDRMRIVPEFRPDEYDQVQKLMFGKLERRLQRWQPEQVELEISVKDRDTSKQRMTLECWISGVPRMVATSRDIDLLKAVVEVRDDMWRQIDRHVTKQETSRKQSAR